MKDLRRTSMGEDLAIFLGNRKVVDALMWLVTTDRLQARNRLAHPRLLFHTIRHVEMNRTNGFVQLATEVTDSRTIPDGPFKHSRDATRVGRQGGA
jgi:hypothetical protein